VGEFVRPCGGDGRITVPFDASPVPGLALVELLLRLPCCEFAVQFWSSKICVCDLEPVAPDEVEALDIVFASLCADQRTRNKPVERLNADKWHDREHKRGHAAMIAINESQSSKEKQRMKATLCKGTTVSLLLAWSGSSQPFTDVL
jgi:hypothetical protein